MCAAVSDFLLCTHTFSLSCVLARLLAISLTHTLSLLPPPVVLISLPLSLRVCLSLSVVSKRSCPRERREREKECV